jgi:hypothetical protein
MIDENFWLNIGISPRNIERFQKSQLKHFKDKIIACSLDMIILKKFFGISELNIKDEKAIKKLFENQKIKEFYGLFIYSMSKLDILKEFFTGEGMPQKYIDTPLLGLLYLYETNPDKIIDSYYYFLYNKSPMSEIWFCDPALNKDIIEKFRSEIINLSKYTKEYKLGKNSLGREFFNNNSFYFCFEKAKKEDVAVGYQERKPIRRRGVYYIKFSVLNNNIEVRTGNPRVLELFSLILKKIGEKVYINQPEETQTKIKDIINKILSNSSEIIKIQELTFNSLERGVNCQTIFRKNNDTKLIDSISTLQEENFIDSNNINNLKDFTVDINGFVQKIQIDRSKANSISFKLTKKGLSEIKYQEIVKAVKDELGIELRQDYSNEDYNFSSIEVFKNIIGKMPSSFSQKEREIYAMMATKGIVTSNSHPIYVCQDDRKHKFYQKYNDCPNCGGELQKLDIREVVELNKTNLLNRILEKLQDIFGEKNANVVDVRAGKSECKLIYVKGEKNEFYLHYDCGQRLVKKINVIENSIIPVIRIILDKKNNEGGLESQIYAYNLLFDKNESIKKDIEDRIVSKYTNLLLNKTRDSEKQIKDILAKTKSVSGDEFENIVFPVLKNCFYGIYKWGISEKGKPVPDGLFGMKKLDKKFGFSMIYDCKYSDKEYDLNIDEKRKAKDYIRRSGQADEVKSFSKKLSSYLIISNSISPKKFDTFSDDILKLKSWKGKVLLLDLKDLIYLFEQFKRKNLIDSPFKLVFASVFVDKIEKDTSQKIIIDKKLIDDIVQEAEQKTLDINQIQVLDFLKTGIEYLW